MSLKRWVVAALILSLGFVACDDDGDDVVLSAPAKCGPKECADVQYCCDAACGICVDQLVACTQTCE